MGGGTLIQLDARGALNQFLSGAPSISLFQAQFRRHTHFALEHIDVLPAGNPDWGQLLQFVVPRNGDLLLDAFLRIQLPEVRVENTAINWCRHVGYSMIEYAELYVGSTRIERVTGEWLYLNSRLRLPEEKKRTIDFMVGDNGSLQVSKSQHNAFLLMIPLDFWFTRHPSHALPVVALSCEEVSIRVKLKPWQELLQTRNISADPIVPPLPTPVMVVQMAYLEAEERTRYSQQHQVQLIEQVEVVESRGLKSNGSIDLSALHGCSKELWIVFQREQAISTERKFEQNLPNFNDFGNYVSAADRSEGTNMVRTMRLQLNGLDYTTPRDPQFYNVYMPLRRHTSMPPTGVFVLPFCLDPEAAHPTGSLHFDSIDDARLVYVGNSAFQPGHTLARVFSMRYNVLEIRPNAGQARLLFT